MADFEVSVQAGQVARRPEVASEGVQLWLNAQISTATREAYMRHAQRLMIVTGKMPEQCTLADLQKFHEALRNPSADLIGLGRLFKVTPSPSSVNAIMQAVQSLFSFMHRAGVIQANPALMIRLRVQRTKKRVDLPRITDLVIRNMQIAYDGSRRQKERVAAYTIVLLATTGLRASEAGNAKMGDIFFREKDAWISVVGKGSKVREVVLPDFVLEIRRSISGDMEWLIPEDLRASGGRLVVWRAVKRAARLAGVSADEIRASSENIYPHILRHYHASKLLEKGVTLVEARDNLGHGTIAVTSGYLHADEDKRHGSISEVFKEFQLSPGA